MSIPSGGRIIMHVAHGCTVTVSRTKRRTRSSPRGGTRVGFRRVANRGTKERERKREKERERESLGTQYPTLVEENVTGRS